MQFFFSLHPVLQAFLASLLMFSFTSLGALAVFFSKTTASLLTLLTGGAAGIMIAASFFSLLLPALEYEGALPSYVTVTLGFALGGAFILLSDRILTRTRRRFLSAGEGTMADGEKGERGTRCMLLYFAVLLHNIPEGLAVGVAFAEGTAGAAALLLALGIAVQNLPEGMCVAVPLRAKGMSPTKSFLFAVASGAVEIPACLAGVLAAGAVAGLMPWALSFSAGAMIAVVCSELIPECFSGSKVLATSGIVLGFCLMMLLDVALS